MYRNVLLAATTLITIKAEYVSSIKLRRNGAQVNKIKFPNDLRNISVSNNDSLINFALYNYCVFQFTCIIKNITARICKLLLFLYQNVLRASGYVTMRRKSTLLSIHMYPLLSHMYMYRCMFFSMYYR